MSSNYDGLTRNIWTGTWSAGGSFPIALDTELRGTLQSISGTLGDRLTDVSGQRLNEGMLVYLTTGYTSGAVTRNSDTYYKYNLLSGQIRNPSTGQMPNAEDNWTEFTAGGGSGTGASGYSGISGYSGLNGTSVQLAGSVADYTALPTYAAAGTLYIILGAGGGYSAGDGAVSDGSTPTSTWSNIGPIQGPTGQSGYSGFSGSGISGWSGASGQAGPAGADGLSGYSGETGADGASGVSGYSGTPGPAGSSGYSGVQGISGYSGQAFAGDYVSSLIAGTGVEITGASGTGSTPTIAIGQAVAPTDTVTFGNVVIAAGGSLSFEDDIIKAALIGAVPYSQISAASKMYTNADALAGLTINDMKPGDYYYDDVNASMYLCYDTGLGYYDLLDITVRA